jgi:hypothetical protein
MSSTHPQAPPGPAKGRDMDSSDDNDSVKHLQQIHSIHQELMADSESYSRIDDRDLLNNENPLQELLEKRRFDFTDFLEGPGNSTMITNANSKSGNNDSVCSESTGEPSSAGLGLDSSSEPGSSELQEDDEVLPEFNNDNADDNHSADNSPTAVLALIPKGQKKISRRRGGVRNRWEWEAVILQSEIEDAKLMDQSVNNVINLSNTTTNSASSSSPSLKGGKNDDSILCRRDGQSCDPKKLLGSPGMLTIIGSWLAGSVQAMVRGEIILIISTRRSQGVCRRW